MRRSDQRERRNLHQTFATLCRIDSPSGREGACARWVRDQLEPLGLTVEEDGAGPAAASDTGNLLVRVPGDGHTGSISAATPIMLCAHLDTVPAQGPIEPVLVEGGWVNAHRDILGADNKAAVAMLVELGRRLAERPARREVELLFTVSEENGLRGATHFDVTRLRSAYGFVFDHASPIGEVILAAPTYGRLLAHVHGRAAHAGLRPEDGRSAIAAASRAVANLPLGRLEQDTTTNVGTIHGGSATNVVPDSCVVDAEVRSLREPRVQELLTTMIDAFQDAADAGECDLDVTVQRLFRGYRVRARAPEVLHAERALRRCGYEPRRVSTGGGSDVNAFIAAGFPALNLANGTERNHEPGERVSAEALEGMYEVVLALVEDEGSSAPDAGSSVPVREAVPRLPEEE